MGVANKELKVNDLSNANNTRPALSRVVSLYGEDATLKLAASHVAIFGIGGVGGYATEAIARCGIGEITIVDKDVVEESNINRQIIATYDTIGCDKVSVMEARIKSINPNCKVNAVKMFFGVDAEDNGEKSDDDESISKSADIDFTKFDYVIDAVDNITAKLLLIESCKVAGVPIICSMGTAGKKDAGAFEITMLSKTSNDGLAKVMRRECKKRGLGDVKVVFSSEESVQASEPTVDATAASKTHALGSAPHVPPVAGLMLAGEVINYLTKN